MIDKIFWQDVEKKLKYVLYGDSVAAECKIIFSYLGIVNRLQLKDFWNRLLDIGYNYITKDDREYIFLDNNIKILTYNPVSFNIENRSPTYIMRHKFVGDIVNIRTNNRNIRVTKNHSLIDIIDDRVIKVTPYDTDRVWFCDNNNEIFPLKIKEIYNQHYDDFVYDLEVPETHNFIINDILVHNTDSLFIHIPSIDSSKVEESIEKSSAVAENINNIIKNYLDTTLLPKLHVSPEHNFTNFKTEFTCNSIMFLDIKKNYAYRMTSKEGKICKPGEDVQYTGIPVVRTNTSEFSRELLVDLIQQIALSPNLDKSSITSNLNQLAKEKYEKLNEQIKNGNFRYFATPVKWNDGAYTKDPSGVVGMRLYNTIMKSDIFKPLSSGLQIPINIKNGAKIKELVSEDKYKINLRHLSILNYICLPYNYDKDEVFKLFNEYNIEVINNIWEKLLSASIIQKVIELIKDYAKK